MTNFVPGFSLPQIICITWKEHFRSLTFARSQFGEIICHLNVNHLPPAKIPVSKVWMMVGRIWKAQTTPLPSEPPQPLPTTILLYIAPNLPSQVSRRKNLFSFISTTMQYWNFDIYPKSVIVEDLLGVGVWHFLKRNLPNCGKPAANQWQTNHLN